MAEHLAEVVGHRPRLVRSQRRNGDFIEQVVKKGRLGQYLHIQERRRRLGRDRGELREAMQAARGVDVDGRHGEQEPPAQGRDLPSEASDNPDASAAEDVVGSLDGLQQGVEMARRPGFLGRGDEHQGHRRAGHPPGQGLAAPLGRLDDDELALPAALSEKVGDPLGDAPGRRGVSTRDRHDPNARRGQRVAPREPLQLVSIVVDHAGLPASQVATAREKAA